MSVRKPFVSLVLSLFLIVTFTAPAFAEKTGDLSDEQKGRPNLVWDVMDRKSAIIYLINTTPYDMLYKSSDFTDQRGAIDHPEQSPWADLEPFIFSPSGLPHKIPARSGTGFVVSWLDTAAPSAYNDNEIKQDASLNYTMKNVDSSYLYTPNCGPLVGDVDIHLAWARAKDSTSLNSTLFKTVLHASALITDSVEFVTEGSAKALYGALISAAELTEDALEINEKNNDTDQMYFSAYPIGKSGNTTEHPTIYTTTPRDDAKKEDSKTAAKYDALYSELAPASGCPQSYIVSSMAILREKSASNGKLDGHLPIVFVTLLTYQDWQSYAASQTQVSLQESVAGNKISQHLQREKRKGQIAFVKLAHTLKPAESRLFIEAYQALRSHQRLSQEQENLLARFAVALEKNEKTLPADTTPKSQFNNTPVTRKK